MLFIFLYFEFSYSSFPVPIFEYFWQRKQGFSHETVKPGGGATPRKTALPSHCEGRRMSPCDCRPAGSGFARRGGVQTQGNVNVSPCSGTPLLVADTSEKPRTGLMVARYLLVCFLKKHVSKDKETRTKVASGSNSWNHSGVELQRCVP